MSSVCVYFQIHQPFRLKTYSFFRIGNDHFYEATALNVEILNRVSNHCYLPTNALIKQLIEETDGKFKVTFSISGTCLEQLNRHRPDVLASFRQLYETGCVDFLAETYYHSLASLYSPTEFVRQVKMHESALNSILGVKPTGFRNTELLYQNGLADLVYEMGYKIILAEGVPKNLGRETPNQIFTSKGGKLKMLLRNYILSDDIAFRFSDPTWGEFPLTAAKFAGWLHELKKDAPIINLFMDYETFGEHRKVDTGIFDFLRNLPNQVLKDKNASFATVTDLLKGKTNSIEFDAPGWTSWADEDKDTSAWTEDNMQKDALRRLYECEEQVMEQATPELLDVWGKLQTSDHFYYMSARYRLDPTHAAFTHYPSPYDAYLNYMNVLSDFRRVLGM